MRGAPTIAPCPRPERRRPRDEGRLELALPLVDERVGEPGAVAEAAIERADSDSGFLGNGGHRDVTSLPREQCDRRGEDTFAVLRGVAP